MGSGNARSADNSLAHRHLTHITRQNTIDDQKEAFAVSNAVRDLRDQAKILNDYAASAARTVLLGAASYYAGLLQSLYSAVNAASADYTDILNMEDAPGIGEALFEGALAGLKVVAPEVKAIKEAMETVGDPAEIATGAIAKVFDATTAHDPNSTAKLRITAARNFFSDLDTAKANLQRKFTEAMSAIDVWQFGPQGRVLTVVQKKLREMKATLYYSTPHVKDPTNLFTDVFLYDMVKVYVKANVALSYHTGWMGFPGGDYAHLSPRDPFFDSLANYTQIDGLSKDTCETLYKMFGKNSPHARALEDTGRDPVSRPGDFVTVWGASFFRNGRKELLMSDGEYVSRQQ